MVSKRKNARENERGFGLIGVMLSVLIVALLSVGVYSYFSSGSAQAKAYSEAQFASALASGVKSLYSNGVYTGLTTQVAIDAKVADASRISGTTILSSLGGTISLAPATINNTNDALELSYSAVPASSCVQFVKNASGAFDKVTLTGTGATATTTTLKAAGTPLSIASTSTACAGAGASSIIKLQKL